MLIQIENIEFNFRLAGSDAINDQSNLGINHLIMPGRMADRFRRENGGTIPYYGIDESRDAGSSHECYNSDTQIVLMNWLFRKRRKYKIDYWGLDPFWIYHDHFHAKHDVWGMEIQGIWSLIEKERLLQGAVMAFRDGHGITADTLIKLDAAWTPRRWRHELPPEPLVISEFYKYMTAPQRSIAEYWEQEGTDAYQSPGFPDRWHH